MAKARKDKKKAGKAPKEAAKVAKGLKKAGKAALKLAGQPAVSEAVAAAMLSAAAALREPPSPKRGGAGGPATADPAEEALRQASGLGEALRALAIDVARRTVDAWEDAVKNPPGKAPHS
jgi:hypothetical protein